MAKKVSVGLVVLTEIPEMGVVAVLQRRGEFDHEKMGPESCPGACQVTSHGKMEESDKGDFVEALRRETDEELGSGVFSTFFQQSTEIMRIDSEDKLVVTFGVFCPQGADLLRSIRLNASSGGIRLVRQEELDQIADISVFHKTEGVTNRHTVAMFPDEIEAVRLAFEKLSPQQP